MLFSTMVYTQKKGLPMYRSTLKIFKTVNAMKNRNQYCITLFSPRLRADWHEYLL